MATVTAAGCGGLGAVTETLPGGSGCASSGLDDEEVQAAGQQVRFTPQWASPSPYIVNAGSEEAVYPFPGMLRDSGRKDTPVGGASRRRATVPQPSNPGPLCAPRTTRPPFLFPLGFGLVMKICRCIGPGQRASTGVSRPVWGAPPLLLRLWKKSPLG